jgi:hypothetical protein
MASNTWTSPSIAETTAHLAEKRTVFQQRYPTAVPECLLPHDNVEAVPVYAQFCRRNRQQVYTHPNLSV